MKQDQIHGLISNLTKSEKRYFRLFSKRSGDKGPKNYLHLFDILESMETYNEDKLVMELAKKELVRSTYLQIKTIYTSRY